MRHTPFLAAIETLFMLPGRGSTTTSTKLNWPYRRRREEGGGGRRRRRREGGGGGGREEEAEGGGGGREEEEEGGRRRREGGREDVGREGRREDRQSCMSTQIDQLIAVPTLMVPKEYDCEESL